MNHSRLSQSVATVLVIVWMTGSNTSRGDENWIKLFDGKTLAGWSLAAHGKAEYLVKDGTIYGKTVEGSPNSFLMTDQEFADFEFEFEVRVHDSLNSGVQIRSREKTAADIPADQNPRGGNGVGRFHGPQVEVEASPGWSGYIYGEATALGWLSNEPKSDSKPHSLMKNGEWNHFKVIAQGARIQTWINGKPVADLTHEDIYRTHPTGRIGLQVHGIAAGTGPFDVAWRNLRIRRL